MAVPLLVEPDRDRVAVTMRAEWRRRRRHAPRPGFAHGSTALNSTGSGHAIAGECRDGLPARCPLHRRNRIGEE